MALKSKFFGSCTLRWLVWGGDVDLVLRVWGGVDGGNWGGSRRRAALLSRFILFYHSGHGDCYCSSVSRPHLRATAVPFRALPQATSSTRTTIGLPALLISRAVVLLGRLLFGPLRCPGPGRAGRCAAEPFSLGWFTGLLVLELGFDVRATCGCDMKLLSANV